MRIIAGSHRGRLLLAPATSATRPITDRAKQSLFDVLQSQIENSVVYDCFAGTGSMGLECLSRGASHATFFEMERSAVSLLRKNIQSLELSNQSTVISGDLFRWFARAAVPKTRVDLIFLDPPYRMLQENGPRLLSLASQLMEHLTANGVVIFRHHAADQLQFTKLSSVDCRHYGGMTIELLMRS